MHLSLALVCVLVLALSTIEAFPNGSPSISCPTTSATLNVDGAGVHPIIDGTGGYSLIATAASWTAGMPVTLQLRGNAAWTGILIVGYKTGTATQVGTWALSPGYKLVSATLRPAALTQSTASSKGPNVGFSWIPPAAGMGSVEFRALVVQSVDVTYLLDVALTLAERAPTLAPTTAAPTTIQPTTAVPPTVQPTTTPPPTVQPTTTVPPTFAPTAIRPTTIPDPVTLQPTSSVPTQMPTMVPVDPTPTATAPKRKACTAADPLFICTDDCALFQCETAWGVRIRIPCPRGTGCFNGRCIRGRTQCKSTAADRDRDDRNDD